MDCDGSGVLELKVKALILDLIHMIEVSKAHSHMFCPIVMPSPTVFCYARC